MGTSASLLEALPIAAWKEDWSALAERLRASAEPMRPEEVLALLETLPIVEAERSALTFFGVKTPLQLRETINASFSSGVACQALLARVTDFVRGARTSATSTEIELSDGESIPVHVTAVFNADRDSNAVRIALVDLRSVGGDRQGATINAENQADRQRAGRRLLEMIAVDQPLSATMSELSRHLEQLVGTGAVAAIVTSTERGADVYMSEDQPPALVQAIQKIKTRLFTSARAPSTPIRISEMDADLSRVLEAHRLRYCMLHPIPGNDGKTLGSVVVFAWDPGRFVDRVVAGIASSAHLAGIALSRARRTAQLRESESRLRYLFEHAHTGILSADLDWRLQYANAAFRRMLGYDVHEIQGKTLVDILDPADRDSAMAILNAIREGHREYSVFEARYIRKGGSRVWARISASAQRETSGVVAGILAITEDITVERSAEAETERMNALRRIAAELSGLGAWEMDARSTLIIWSDELRRILDYPPDFEPTFESTIVLYHPDDLPSVRLALEECMTHGTRADMEVRIRSREGRQFPCRLIMEAARGHDGSIERIQGALQDLSAQKSAELEIARGRERFRQLADAMPIMVWTAQADGRLEFTNAYFRAYAGIEGDMDPDQAWRECIHPEDLSAIGATWLSDRERSMKRGVELRLRRAADGLYRWHVARSIAVKQADGAISYWYGTATDIHDTKVMEQEARSLARRLFSTVESITDAFFTLDHEWRITYMNAEAERLLERSRLELLGRNIWQEFPPAVDTVFYIEYHRAVNTGTTVSFEEHYPPLQKWFEVKAYPSSDGLTVYFQDATERRRRDAQLALLAVCIERINDIVMILEVHGDDAPSWNIAYVNAAFERQTGFHRDDVVGRRHGDVFPLRVGDQAMEQIRGDMIAGRQSRGEFLKEGKDGKAFWVEADIVPVRAGDRITHWVAIERNVSERRVMEEELRTREERFRLLSNATNDAIWDWDLRTNALWVNEGFERLFRMPGGSFDPGIDSWTKYIHPDDRDRVVNTINEVLQGDGSDWLNEYRFLRADGTTAEVIDRGSVMREDGEPVRLFGGIVDITRRKEAERKLAEHAELLNKTQDSIIVRDLEHSILFWSNGAQRLYGWTAEEALGERVDRLIYTDLEEFRASMEVVLQQGEWSGEIEHRDRSGRPIFVFSRWSLIQDDDGKPVSVLAINTDITERKALEEQVIRAQRLESIGTLAGGIAHDLNNVFAPILLNVDLLKMDEQDPDRASVLAALEADARRGAHMVRQVLTFARGAEGRREKVDPVEVVREVERVLGDTLSKSIAVSVQHDADTWSIIADSTQLYQVVMNLCVNARDAMPDGGQLSIALENHVIDDFYARLNLGSAPGPYVVISVSDTGIGMTPDVIDRLWEPFFTTKEVGGGTGLGLPTSHTIIKRLGGFINVYSEPGKGSEFKVYLPADASPRATDIVAVRQTRLPRGDGRIVLVVDDEESVRNVVRKTLERFGYKVLLAQNGAVAVALYARHFEEIDVVLTDMAMPIMDGPSTIIALQQINPNVLIIGSSGLGANGNVAKAAGAGVQYFVPKPYTVESLLRTLRTALGEPDDSSSPHH